MLSRCVLNRIFYGILQAALVSSVALQAQAETVASTPSNLKTSDSTVTLPVCIDQSETLDNIRRIQRANRRSIHKYNGYRQAFTQHAVTEEEILARLVYAETLASHCPEHSDQSVELISATLINRIQRRSGNILEVVFERDQFASSLNIYSESQYREFLCPKNLELWRNALTTTRQMLRSSTADTSTALPLPSDSVNYYFYKHSSRFTPPAWTKSLEEVRSSDGQPLGEEFRECVRFFRNPRYGS